MELSVIVPDVADIIREPQRFLDAAKVMVIDCPEMFEAAADDLKKIKACAAAAEADRKKLTGPLDQVKADIMAKYKPAADFCAEAERILKAAMVDYSNRVAAARALEEKKLRDKAEAERQALEAQAAAQEAAGDHESAEETKMTAAIVSAPPASIEKAAAQGVSFRENWKAEVEDIYLLCQYAVENPDYLNLVEANMQALNTMAKGLKGNLKIPGVKAVCEKVLSARKA